MVSPNSFIAEGYNLQLAIRQAASGTSNNKTQWYNSVLLWIFFKGNVMFFSECMNICKVEQRSAS